MQPTAAALVGLVAWSLVLTLLIVTQRSLLVLTGNRKANEFLTDGSDVSAFSNRVCRAHANCYENLPLIGALLLFAMVTDRTAVTDPFALWFLAARVAQSVTHLISTGHVAVSVRFAFFLVQVGIMVLFCIRFLVF